MTIKSILKLIRRRLGIFPSSPATIQIGITNRCNMDCKMCQRRHLNLKYEDMPFDIYKKIIDRIPESIKTVDLTGWGEPTIHPAVFEIVSYAKSKGFKVSFTTNGLLLDSNKQEKVITSCLDRITFSIENINSNCEEIGHGNSRKVLENVKALLKLRGQRKIPEINFQITLHQDKVSNLFELIKYARKMRVEVINIIRLDIRFNQELKRPTWPEEMRIYREAQKAVKKYGVIVQSNYSFYRCWQKLFYPPHLCPKIYDYIYINLDGEVTPCCSLPAYSMGDILRIPLIEVWQGENFKRFRKNQEKICGKCDVMRYRYLK